MSDWKEQTSAAVRPYVITGGRAGSVGRVLPWETLVTASNVSPPSTLQPEYRRILAHCQGLLSLAEVSAHLGQPPSVVQVLIADLVEWGLARVRPPAPPAQRHDADLLRKVLDALESRL